jgi:hypothetical protein
MDRKLVIICVLAVIFAVMVISGCTSGPASPTVTIKPGGNATLMPSASPGTYAGAGGFAQNASGNASVAPSPGVTPPAFAANNTTTGK